MDEGHMDKGCDHGTYASDGSFSVTIRRTDSQQARAVGPVVRPPVPPGGVIGPPVPVLEEPAASPLAEFNHTDDKSSVPVVELYSGPDETKHRKIVDNGRDSAAGVSCEYLIYRPPDISGDQYSWGDQALSDADTCIVEVKVFWIDSPRSPTVSVPLTSGEAGQIVVQRLTSFAPTREPAWASHTLVESPNGESGDSDPFAERVRDAFDDYVAKRLVDPAWEKSVEGWVTPVCEDMASAAESLSGLHDQWHQLILGEPIQSLTGLTPLADIAAEVALPGDTLLANTKLLIEGIGIGIGLMAGHPLLVNACLKSFTHDAVVKVVSKGIGDFLTNTLDPAGTRECELNDREVRSELERQIKKPQEQVPAGPPRLGGVNGPLADEPQINPNEGPPDLGIRGPRL